MSTRSLHRRRKRSRRPCRRISKQNTYKKLLHGGGDKKAAGKNPMNPARAQARENWDRHMRLVSDPNRPIVPLRGSRGSSVSEEQQRAYQDDQTKIRIMERNHWTLRNLHKEFVPRNVDRNQVFFIGTQGHGFAPVIIPGESVQRGHPFLAYKKHSERTDIGGGIVPDDVDLWFAIVDLKRSDDIQWRPDDPNFGIGRCATLMRIRLKAEKDWDVDEPRLVTMIREIDRGIHGSNWILKLLYDVVLNRYQYTTRIPETLTPVSVASPEPESLAAPELVQGRPVTYECDCLL